MPPTRVVAGVLVKEGKILLCRRGPGMKLAGYWELPGGKVEPGEEPAAALTRELREELGVKARVGAICAVNTHAYEFGVIELRALRVDSFMGEPRPTEHDRLEWVAPAALESYQLAPADVPIARALAKSAESAA